jgi:hypothetical protein
MANCPSFGSLTLLLVPKQLEIHKDFVPLRRERRQGWKAGVLHKHLCLLVSGNYQTKIETI